MTTHYPQLITTIIPTYTEINYSQAGAAQNTWYTALEVSNVSVGAFAVGCTVADETLEARVTVDSVLISSAAGVACTFAANPYSNLPAIVVCTTGQAVFTQGAANAAVTSLDSELPWIKGKTVKIEVRKTTAGGASAVTGKGYYHQFSE